MNGWTATKPQIQRPGALTKQTQLFHATFHAHGVPLSRGCQTINKVGRFSLPIKSANKNLSSVVQISANFVSCTKLFDFIVQCRTCSVLNDKIGQLFGYRSPWWLFVVGDEYLFSYLFWLLLYGVYFRSLNTEKIMQVSFCDLHSAVVYSWSWLISYVVANDQIGRVSWFNDAIGRFSRATKPCPQKLANFDDRLTDPLGYCMCVVRTICRPDYFLDWTPFNLCPVDLAAVFTVLRLV